MSKTFEMVEITADGIKQAENYGLLSEVITEALLAAYNHGASDEIHNRASSSHKIISDAMDSGLASWDL